MQTNGEMLCCLVVAFATAEYENLDSIPTTGKNIFDFAVGNHEIWNEHNWRKVGVLLGTPLPNLMNITGKYASIRTVNRKR